MFPASVFRTARGSSRSRGWIVGVLAHGVDHTTRTLLAAVTSTGAAGHKQPDPPGTNERYSRVRTPAVNTPAKCPPGSSPMAAKEGYEEKRKEGSALSHAPRNRFEISRGGPG